VAHLTENELQMWLETYIYVKKVKVEISLLQAMEAHRVARG
jgi:hypothetical protein